MPNQNKPTPPLDDIEPHIMRMWKAHLTDRQIVAELCKVIDTNEYGIGLTKFIVVCKQMGLIRTHEQGHTADSIQDVMVELRAMYPNAGAREMISLLHHERNMSVSRSVIREYFATYEPHLIHHRKARCLQHHHFWAAGVNDIWAVDQHDKWNKFGLALHTGIELFSGKILWIRVWHSNRNPQLILTYYLDVVEELGFIPLVTQSDPGSENFGIANAQTMLRQWHDPALEGTLQHRWMCSRKNIKPEIMWSQLRRHFTPGFESLLEYGVHQGWYDIDNTLQCMIFQWIFIPWLQEELNGYRERVNYTMKRHDCHKVLPHGVPKLMFRSPQDYGAIDFKFMVDKATLTHVRELYLNTGHPVFDLVPRPLNGHIEECYHRLGRPAITRSSVWDVYLDLLHALQNHALLLPVLDLLPVDIDVDDSLPLLRGQRELPFKKRKDGYCYMGGASGGLGLGKLLLIRLRLNEAEIFSDDDCVDKLDDVEGELDVMEEGPNVVVSDFSDEEVDDNDSSRDESG
ncbi:hypothetical protein M404DRAFT_153118 [Pisolithus tinctorius Marx 270]|uniref:Integrase core domain-containing protein n=1 Tax=Pisolithus tinctorius Marx 270 TaxID=870435 RepID=A0A0C3JS52_PISTI|nr:hypothetical protein M404DRAFT_153118 [Pisolithus tinctorius Marx 270]